MTIKQRLNISFFLILSIIIFIIGVFFYTLFNLNEIHNSQNNRYDQIRRVDKLKEYNNSFSWIVLDIINDYEKIDVVNNRINRTQDSFQNLILQKKETIDNSESKAEKENLIEIFSHFKNMQILIEKELYNLVVYGKVEEFDSFNNKFANVSKQINKLIEEELIFLQSRLDETERDKEHFTDTIKIELVILFLVAFTLSLLISSKISNYIQNKLFKLNKGVLQLFEDDENKIKVDIGENNELSELTNNLNSYLEKQSDVIHSREELLRNISHELKTPITKGKFLLDSLKRKSDLEELESISHVFVDIEELTSKLLEREKLNYARLDISKFKVSSLILQSLSKLSIDDESKIILEIEDDFNIKADKYYLTIALKNLIDNAMKYADEYPIKIKAVDNQLFIENIAKELSNDFIYYIQPFTREPNQQLGHGLGLNIVNKIIQLHHFKLDYKYKKPYNSFSISF